MKNIYPEMTPFENFHSLDFEKILNLYCNSFLASILMDYSMYLVTVQKKYYINTVKYPPNYSHDKKVPAMAPIVYFWFANKKILLSFDFVVTSLFFCWMKTFFSNFISYYFSLTSDRVVSNATFNFDIIRKHENFL